MHNIHLLKNMIQVKHHLQSKHVVGKKNQLNAPNTNITYRLPYLLCLQSDLFIHSKVLVSDSNNSNVSLKFTILTKEVLISR